MSQTENKFEIRATISPSDKEFRSRISVDVWERIKSKALRDDGFKCQGCGFEPYDVSADKVLDVHLVEENIINPEDSKFRTECMLCHMIEHADAAISNEYVILVNSKFSQGELVNICRNRAIPSNIEDGSIRILKKTLPEFLEELKNGKALEGKVKLIFTEKYLKRLDINPF
ncbi:MAG: hypothetical protein AABY15_08990 [Nanoarchaeota archaeon]